MITINDRETVIALTPLWKGERFPDGRPKVPDKYLDALYGMTLEEVWNPIFVLGYEHQFVGGGEAPLQTLHDDGRKLVGKGNHDFWWSTASKMKAFFAENEDAFAQQGITKDAGNLAAVRHLLIMPEGTFKISVLTRLE